MTSGEFSLLAGSASGELAGAIARAVEAPLAACAIKRFPDGEVSVSLGISVRRKDVFLIQSTSPPVNDPVELLALIGACRRAAAGRITAVIPYFGDARQDRRPGRREPVTARLVGNLLEAAGVDHICDDRSAYTPDGGLLPRTRR